MLEAGDRVSDEEGTQYGTVRDVSRSGNVVRVRLDGGHGSIHKGREIDRDLRKVNF